MSKLNNFLLIIFLIFFIFYNCSLVIGADSNIKLNTVLTSNGLDDSGLPVRLKKEFSLSKDQAVQYYTSWIQDDNAHQIVLKWIGPEGRLINRLKLFNFKSNVVKSYINLQKIVGEQLIVPQITGKYLIELYIDGELLAITEFKLRK
jgi:hypothetical protein